MARSVLFVGLLTGALGSQEHHALNPIRKAVSLLQAMQKKVQAEGEKERELYNKFMCFCKTGTGDITSSIGGSETKIPAVSSDIDESGAKLSGAKGDLKRAQTDRTAAQDAIAQATAMREKEAAAFAKYKSEHDTNIAAITKAVDALEKGVAGSFLQSPAASILRRVVMKSDLPEIDQDTVTAFLSQSSEYAPQSGEIIGILKQMGDTMAANLASATSDEQAAIKTFDGLVHAKKQEIEALTSTVEGKTQQIGDLGVSIVRMQNDLAETQATLAEDKAFLADLSKSCATKTSEWEARSKTRAEELVALADTIKVLNDDEALDLFKNTLPSLLQVTSAAPRQLEALSAIRSSMQKATVHDKPGLELLVLALTGKKAATSGGFDKVMQMIDNMVGILKAEQDDDNHKKEYCAAQFDTSDDKKKALERSVAGEEAAIVEAKEAIATLSQEIAALEAGIRALDKAVAEATAQRKDENTEYKALMASDTAAREVLAFAKNRLNKFYNPKLYKAAPKVELSAEDRAYKSLGNPDDLVTTAAPGGIAGTGIAVLAQVFSHEHKAAPPPPPATWGAYATKSEENTGVIAMLDLLSKDLEKEMTEATTEEKDAQADYEQLMKDSAAKRTVDSNALAEKGSSKADTEAELQAHASHKVAEGKDLMATVAYIASLHAECDWLVQYFDVRKEARAGEVESLKRAKAVLSGADFSFIQTQAHGFLARPHQMM